MANEISIVAAVKAKRKVLEAKKNMWLDHYQLIGEFVNNKKQNFTEVNEPGTFLTRDLFDNTAQKSAEVSSSAFIGALWPSAAQSFELVASRGISDTEENREYFRFITEENISIMDDSRSGLAVALTEYMPDQVTFGTSAIAVFKNEGKNKKAIPVRYVAWDVKTMLIDEDENGFIDTIINVRSMTIRQMVKEYGLKNLSSESQELFRDKELDKRVVIHIIAPRLKGSQLQFGNKSMPIMSLHFEEKGDHILKESGFDSMPVFVTRLMKAMGEVQGRSFAMAALPDIIQINVVKEVRTVIREKQAEPPLAVLGDGDLGTTTIDTSAGAINVFNISNRLGAKSPIVPLFTTGDVQGLTEEINELKETITNHFLIDRLLDLNNETRMTLGEANIRNELRGQSLGSSFTRQKAELFNNIIERTVDINFQAGRLGVFSGSEEEAALIEKGIEPIIIPEEIAERIEKGEEVFKINYISPAERAIKAEEVQGNLATLNVLATTVPLSPETVDVINLDDIIRRTAELTGASKEVINGLDVVKQIREGRNALAAQDRELQQAREGSETMRNLAQAKGTIDNQNAQAA